MNVTSRLELMRTVFALTDNFYNDFGGSVRVLDAWAGVLRIGRQKWNGLVDLLCSACGK